MDKELANELHKPVVRKFERRKVVVHSIDEIFGADLVDMSEWADQNDGNDFILTVIDCFSKYAWAYPLKKKTGANVKAALIKLFSEGRKPQGLWVDQGSEFYNKDVKEYLTKNKIELYSTFGDHKSAIIERFNRTLKTNMYKLFTENNNRKWIKNLPELLKDYNNTVHRTVKMTPVEASKEKNEFDVYENIMKRKDKKYPKPKLKVGDWVRISRIKGTFEKGYIRNWSYEIFKVVEVKDTKPVTYKIVEYDGSPIEGLFYEQELQKTKEADTFLVDEVLQTKTKNGKKEHLVHWLGWPDKYNSWISDKDLKDLKK